MKDCGWQDGREAGMLLGWQRLSLRAMHSPPPGPFPSPPSLGWADLAEGRFRGLGACVGGGKGRERISSGGTRERGTAGGGVREDATSRKSLGRPAASRGGEGGRAAGGQRPVQSGVCARSTMTAPGAGGWQGRAMGLPWLGLEACAGPACSGARRRADGCTAMAARTRPGPRRARAPARAAAAAAAGGRGGRSRAAGGGAGSADKGGAEGGGGRGAAASPSRAGGDSRAAPRRRGPREGAVSEETPNPPERGAEGEGAKMAAAGGRALSSWVPAAAAGRPGRWWWRLRRAGEGAGPASPLSRQYKRFGASPRTCPSQNGGRERAEVT